MKKKNFTLIELLVVITIIAILAAMLFPTFGKMQRKAQQNNSMNQTKQIMTGVAGYFTDVRKKNLPKLSDVYQDYTAGATTTVTAYDCPAGGGQIGYAGEVGTDSNDGADDWEVADSIAAETNSTAVSSDGDVADGATFVWLDINTDESLLLTTNTEFTKTVNQKPAAYGDGHAGVVGKGE